MNYKDPKIQIIAFVVMLFLVASYFWYTKVYSDYAGKIASKKAEYEKELADLHSVKQKAATLDDLQREFDDLQIKYKNVELLLPEIKEDESFLSQIHAAAQVTIVPFSATRRIGVERRMREILRTGKSNAYLFGLNPKTYELVTAPGLNTAATLRAETGKQVSIVAEENVGPTEVRILIEGRTGLLRSGAE